MGISVPAEIPAKPNGGCRESHANYYEKYCDERDRAVRAEREVNRVEREALHAERRADELKRRLVDQQERILHSVMVELKNEKVDPEVIARVHAAIVDYSSTAGTCDTCGRPVTEPGDTGARLPQPERP
jgi:hypothetical protein